MGDRDIWPELRARAEARIRESGSAKQGDGLKPGTSTGRALAPYMRASLVQRAEIYQEPTSWGVNIFLDESRLAPGLAAVFGTPTGEGLKTPEAAIEAGVAIAIALLEGDRNPDPVPSESVGFTLYGWSLEPPRDILEKTASLWASLERENGHDAVIEAAGAMIASAAKRLGITYTAPPDVERLRSDPETAGELFLGMVLALHGRTAAYPFRTAASDAETDPGHQSLKH